MTDSSIAHRRRVFGGRVAAVAAAAFLSVGGTLGVPVARPAAAPTASAATTLPSGFVDETIVTGLHNPTSIVYAPGGRVFVGEKRGIVMTWATAAAFAANGTPTQTVDLRNDVMNYWDRGFLGMAVDPAWPASPYLYLLYSYDALPGGTAPHWNRGDPDNDPCPNPPGGNSDGCVITNRLDRVTVNTTTGVATARNQMLVGWCQQFPSHSAGSVAFGADGKLYVTAGEGASFNGGSQDWGQLGGKLPDAVHPVTPKNPCGDPPGGGDPTVPMTAPTAEGGALRSQSFRRPASESAVLNGTVLRLDKTTGAAAADNPAIGNPDPIRRRIVAYGLRNPFRVAFRPGTNDLYVGDVGYSTWEEVNRVPNPTSGPLNFGWPCYEGDQTKTYYTDDLNLCTSLSAGSVTSSLWDYKQSGHMATNDGCPPIAPATKASASISGLAFYSGASYPAAYRKGLFVADYSRNCIVYLPDSGNGVPAGTSVPFASSAANPVTITADPNGDLVYGDFGGGAIHRIRYQPPVASFSVTPPSGGDPLLVAFDAGGSTAPAGISSYAWDFGDGGMASGKTTSHTYAAGTWTARLTITDSNGITASATRTINAANTPPVVTLDQPTCTDSCWKVGDVIQLAAHATDAEDGGTLPPSAFSWHVGLEHCHSADDCHEHDLFDPVGVASSSFVAPDHDAGSWLRITVTATDSDGLSGSVTHDFNPKTGTLRVVSNPAGLPVTLDETTAAGSVGPVTDIVGHSAVISAAPKASSGEDSWTFASWSDGGAISHNVTVSTTAQTRTATYTKTASDAPNTCSAATIQSVTGAWNTGRFGTTNDVDWVRFKVARTGWYRFVLGALPVDATLSLYSGCSTLLVTSAQAGTHWEEIVRSLAPGTYALRMSSVGGVSSTTSHQFLLQALSGTVPLIGARTVATTSIRLAGEVMNTSSLPRSVTVTARLYSASGTLLKTVSSAPLVRILGKSGRSAFVIKTTRPSGFSYARYAVSSTSASKATRLLPVSGVTATAPTSGTWRVTGTITNTSTTTARSVAYVVTLFDSRGRVLDATAAGAPQATLAPKAKTTFTVTFGGIPTPPTATSARARAL